VANTVHDIVTIASHLTELDNDVRGGGINLGHLLDLLIAFKDRTLVDVDGVRSKGLTADHDSTMPSRYHRDRTGQTGGTPRRHPRPRCFPISRVFGPSGTTVPKGRRRFRLRERPKSTVDRSGYRPGSRVSTWDVALF
jgi:hypothetical protein